MPTLQEPPLEDGQQPDARWRGLRLAACCIGIAEYGQGLGTLQNALADAEVMYKKINEMPGCRAVLLKNPQKKDERRENAKGCVQKPVF